MPTSTISPCVGRGEEVLRAKCPECGFDLEPMRMARWRRFDRMAWGLGVSAMGLVAFVVISLLGTWLLPNRFGCGNPAGSGDVKATLTILESALVEYSIVNGGRYPDTLQALAVPDENGYSFLGGTRIPKDPWGNDYLYDPPGPEAPWARVYTLGRDGSRGGTGADADVDNISLRTER